MASPDRWMMGIGAVLGLALVRSLTWPWHAAPDEAATAPWSRLAAHAEVDAEAVGDTQLLGAVVEAEHQSPEAGARALIRWSDSKGAVVTALCETPLAELAPVTERLLARHAEVSPALARAALRLSRLLRGSGTREGYVAGVAIVGALGEVPYAVREDLDLDVSADELPAMFAQASLCTDQRYATTDDHIHWQSSNPAADALKGRFSVPWHARHFVDVAREREMFRAWRGGIFVRCVPSRSQREGFHACALTELAKDPLPQSLVVRLESFPLPPLLQPSYEPD